MMKFIHTLFFLLSIFALLKQAIGDEEIPSVQKDKKIFTQGYFKETCGIVQTHKKWTRLSGSKGITKYVYMDCSEAPGAPDNADVDGNAESIVPITYVPYLKAIMKKKRTQTSSSGESKCDDKFEGCKKNGPKILCKVKVGSRDNCEHSYALSTNIHAFCCW